MRQGNVYRLTNRSGDDGTFSNAVVWAKDQPTVAVLRFNMGELPARGNQHDISCLAPMPSEAPIRYLFKWQYSAAHACYKYTCVGVLNDDGSVGPIPGNRVASEIHAANLIGDIHKARAAQLEGCFAPGIALAMFPAGQEFHTFTEASPTKLVLAALAEPQLGVSASGTALAALERELAGEDLALTVSWT